MSYLLGAWAQTPRTAVENDEDEGYDDYNEEPARDTQLNMEELVDANEVEQNNVRLRGYVLTIRALATKARQSAAAEVGDYEDQKPSNRPEWLEEIFQPELRRHDEFADLVSDILSEIEQPLALRYSTSDSPPYT